MTLSAVKLPIQITEFALHQYYLGYYNLTVGSSVLYIAWSSPPNSNNPYKEGKKDLSSKLRIMVVNLYFIL